MSSIFESILTIFMLFPVSDLDERFAACGAFAQFVHACVEYIDRDACNDVADPIRMMVGCAADGRGPGGTEATRPVVPEDHDSCVDVGLRRSTSHVGGPCRCDGSDGGDGVGAVFVFGENQIPVSDELPVSYTHLTLPTILRV